MLTQLVFYDDSSSRSPYPSDYFVKSSIKELLGECFPLKPWAVIRPTDESKSKVKELLIAAGSRMGLKKGTWIEILKLQTEQVENTKLERLIVIGLGKVDFVEGDNFSILKVEQGSKDIKELLDAGQQLKCRRKKK